jgi:hypothetical protein
VVLLNLSTNILRKKEERYVVSEVKKFIKEGRSKV